jgi:hypothetical protein
MPLPKGHLRKLDQDVAVHEKRLQALEASIRAQQVEAEVHRTVVKLGRDPRLLAVLGDLHDDEELARRAAEDPISLAKEHGVDLPAEAEIEVRGSGDVRAVFPAAHLWFEARWKRDEGFSIGELQEVKPGAGGAAGRKGT